MSESLDRGHEVPELTAEQIQARVLHRDGLMLVIDKPAGLPVHRGPKGGANLESSFDALRFGLPRPQGGAQSGPLLRRPAFGPAAPAGARPPARPRYLRLSGAGTPSQGNRVARPAVQAWPDFKNLLGGGRRPPGRG